MKQIAIAISEITILVLLVPGYVIAQLITLIKDVYSSEEEWRLILKSTAAFYLLLGAYLVYA